MPPITDDQYKALILAEIGDDGTVEAQWEVVWILAADDVAETTPLLTATASTRHQYRRAKLRGIDLLLGKNRDQVSQTSASGRQTKLKELIENLELMRRNVLAEIAAAEGAYLQSGGAPLAGDPDTVAPITSPDGAADANARVYRGDPNAPYLSGWVR